MTTSLATPSSTTMLDVFWRSLMSLARTAFYDAEEQTLWVARRFFDVKTRVPKDELMHWAKFLKNERCTEDGRPVQQVNYLFIDEATAAHNYQALTFIGLGVYYQEGGNRIPYLPSDGPMSVQTRVDAGISLPQDPSNEGDT